jgi:hypothetical protein
MIFNNRKFSGGPPTMFICGNDDEAKKTVIYYPHKTWMGNNKHWRNRWC